MAEPIIPKQTKLTKKGNIISIAAWEVPKSKDYPEEINYAFALICQKPPCAHHGL